MWLRFMSILPGMVCNSKFTPCSIWIVHQIVLGTLLFCWFSRNWLAYGRSHLFTLQGALCRMGSYEFLSWQMFPKSL